MPIEFGAFTSEASNVIYGNYMKPENFSINAAPQVEDKGNYFYGKFLTLRPESAEMGVNIEIPRKFSDPASVNLTFDSTGVPKLQGSMTRGDKTVSVSLPNGTIGYKTIEKEPKLVANVETSLFDYLRTSANVSCEVQDKITAGLGFELDAFRSGLIDYGVGVKFSDVTLFPEFCKEKKEITIGKYGSRGIHASIVSAYKGMRCGAMLEGGELIVGGQYASQCGGIINAFLNMSGTLGATFTKNIMSSAWKTTVSFTYDMSKDACCSGKGCCVPKPGVGICFSRD